MCCFSGMVELWHGSLTVCIILTDEGSDKYKSQHKQNIERLSLHNFFWGKTSI